MDMRRFLPIILIVFVGLFALQFLNRGKSNTLSAKDRGALTLDAINRVDRAEQLLFAADGTYTASLADLIARDRVLASELTVPLDVTLDVGTDGKSYVATLTSDVFSVSRARSGEKLTSSSCREVKSTARSRLPERDGEPDDDDRHNDDADHDGNLDDRHGHHQDAEEVTPARAGGSSAARRTSSPPPTPARSAAGSWRR